MTSALVPTSSTPSYLSDNFSYAEATFSKTASKLKIDNTPSPKELANMQKVALSMEKVRALCGNKVVSISSWFRCQELNTAIGSRSLSQHTRGEAVDFNIFRYGSPRKVCEIIVSHAALIRFDQLILEDGWIHISFTTIKDSVPRGQVLTITPNGKAKSGLIYYR